MGKALLFDALSRIEEAADIVDVRAVMVHAIDDAARRFYQHFEFEESPVDPYQLLLLVKDLRKGIHPPFQENRFEVRLVFEVGS